MRFSRTWILLAAILSLLAAAPPGRAKEIAVRNDAELREALQAAEAGTTITLEAGAYRGGIHLRGRKGRPGAHIVIAGRDPENRPLLRGGNTAIQLSDCAHLTLKNLHVSGFPYNGINIDDGGSYDSPSHHILVENVLIEKTGPTGNHDGLKLSGLRDFIVRDCTIRGWGGSAIDMVGCHDGVIEGCVFEGLDKHSQMSGIQMKGGSSDILVHKNFFKNAGRRAINLGGSTGLQFFRPQDLDYEATDIEVAGNRFYGSNAPVAFVTAQGGHVHHNTIVHPDKWVLRILQEQPVSRFKQCAGGVFENNIIVFNAKVRSFVNIGPNTRPDSFTFRNNAWFDDSGNRRPQLPTEESGGLYGVDPEIANTGESDMRATSRDKTIISIGAPSYTHNNRLHDEKE